MFLQRWNPLAEQVKAVLRDYPELKLTQGRKVINWCISTKLINGELDTDDDDELDHAGSGDPAVDHVGQGQGGGVLAEISR